MLAHHLAHQDQLVGLRLGRPAIRQIMTRERNDIQAARAVLFVKLLELREHLFAWFAPGGPELKQNDLSAQSRESRSFAADPLLHFDFGRGLVEQLETRSIIP